MKRKNKSDESRLEDVREELAVLEARYSGVEHERSALEARRHELEEEIINALVRGENSDKQDGALSQVKNRLSLVNDALRKINGAREIALSELHQEERKQAEPVFQELEESSLTQFMVALRALVLAYQEVERFGELSSQAAHLASRYEFTRQSGARLLAWDTYIRQELYSVLRTLDRAGVLDSIDVSLEELKQVGVKLPERIDMISKKPYPTYPVVEDIYAPGGWRILKNPMIG